MTMYGKNKSIIIGWLLRNKSVVEWHIQGVERKTSQPWTLHPIKLAFKDEGEIKIFADKQKWEKLLLAYLPSKKILKEMMLDNNLDLWEGKKNVGNRNLWVNIKDYIIFLLFSLKTTSLFKAINILLYYLVCNIYYNSIKEGGGNGVLLVK